MKFFLMMLLSVLVSSTFANVNAQLESTGKHKIEVEYKRNGGSVEKISTLRYLDNNGRSRGGYGCFATCNSNDGLMCSLSGCAPSGGTCTGFSCTGSQCYGGCYKTGINHR